MHATIRELPSRGGELGVSHMAVFTETDTVIKRILPYLARRGYDVTEDIDLANSPAVRKAFLSEIREKKIPRVIVNLLAVKYIDSSGIASLVEGLKASRDLKARFILFGLSKSAREVLQLSRLLKLFEIYENEEQALSAESV